MCIGMGTSREGKRSSHSSAINTSRYIQLGARKSSFHPAQCAATGRSIQQIWGAGRRKDANYCGFSGYRHQRHRSRMSSPSELPMKYEETSQC